MPELADPLFLLLLLVPPAIYLFASPAVTRSAVLLVPDGIGRRILQHSKDTGRAVAGQHVLPGLIWTLLVVALAGPRLLVPTEALPMSGRDLVIALDLSGSMVREDFSLNGENATRLDAVKAVGAEFVRRRGGDRLSLVVFGSEAYYAAPPTFDIEAVATTIEGLVIGISGRATNISDALGIALKRLSQSPAESRVVIVLSDGVNNAGEAAPLDVAKLARDMGVRVHTIALGPKERAENPNERGVVDAATLQAMADMSGGEMFRVKTTEDLVAVTRAIDELEPTASAGLAAETYRDLWTYPAILAGLLCVFVAWRRQS